MTINEIKEMKELSAKLFAGESFVAFDEATESSEDYKRYNELITKKMSLLRMHEARRRGFVVLVDKLNGTKMRLSEIAAAKKEGFTKYFTLHDDDGEIYFTGYLHKEAKDEFLPLDWATYDYGCTEIKYRNKDTGRMETL